MNPAQIEAAKALDNILTYHEVGGHKGDGSDHALRQARLGLESILAALKAQQPDEGRVDRVARALCCAGRDCLTPNGQCVMHPDHTRLARAAIAAMQESRDEAR